MTHTVTHTDPLGIFVIKMTYLVFYIYCCMLDSPLNSITNFAVRYKISKLSNKTFSYITQTVYFWRIKWLESKVDGLGSKWTIHGGETERSKRLTMNDHVSNYSGSKDRPLSSWTVIFDSNDRPLLDELFSRDRSIWGPPTFTPLDLTHSDLRPEVRGEDGHEFWGKLEKVLHHE